MKAVSDSSVLIALSTILSRELCLEALRQVGEANT